MESDASKYIRIAKGLVKNRIWVGRKEEVGGRDVIDRFSFLVDESQPQRVCGSVCGSKADHTVTSLAVAYRTGPAAAHDRSQRSRQGSRGR